MSHDDHLPAEGQTCEVCGEMGHLVCWPAGLEDHVGPLIALHDAALHVYGEAA